MSVYYSLLRTPWQNPENLLIFAAGNDGDGSLSDCTMGSPATSKNVLSVGASTSGPGRWSWTGDDGEMAVSTSRAQDIDTMAYFSSYGPTLDNRIKPEVVAPGDTVRERAATGALFCCGVDDNMSFPCPFIVLLPGAV